MDSIKYVSGPPLTDSAFSLMKSGSDYLNMSDLFNAQIFPVLMYLESLNVAWDLMSVMDEID